MYVALCWSFHIDDNYRYGVRLQYITNVGKYLQAAAGKIVLFCGNVYLFVHIIFLDMQKLF